MTGKVIKHAAEECISVVTVMDVVIDVIDQLINIENNKVFVGSVRAGRGQGEPEASGWCRLPSQVLPGGSCCVSHCSDLSLRRS